MSQINVDTITPFTSGSGVVNLNGVQASYDNTLVSIKLGSNSTPALGSHAVLVGPQAGSYATGTKNTIVGSQAGKFLTTGQSNTFVGYNSSKSTTIGFNNTSIGDESGVNCTSGSENVFIGKSAGLNVTTGNNNVFIGRNSGYSSSGPITGFYNVAIGTMATISSPTAFGEFVLGSVNTYVLRCNVTSITSLSDARDKKDVTDLRAGLDFVKGLRPVEFIWDDRDENGRHDVADFGFIAQDLKTAQEEAEMADVLKLIYDSNPERLEASYGKLIPILVKAVQELAAKVEQLESK